MNSMNNNLLTTILEKIDREELVYQLRKSYDLLLETNKATGTEESRISFPLGQEIIPLYIEFRILSYLGYNNLPISEVDSSAIVKEWIQFVSGFTNRISEISGLTASSMEESLISQLVAFEEGIKKLPFYIKIHSLLKEEFVVAPHRRVAFKSDYARIRNTVTSYSYRNCLSPLGNEEINIRIKRK